MLFKSDLISVRGKKCCHCAFLHKFVSLLDLQMWHQCGLLTDTSDSIHRLMLRGHQMKSSPRSARWWRPSDLDISFTTPLCPCCLFKKILIIDTELMIAELRWRACPPTHTHKVPGHHILLHPSTLFFSYTGYNIRCSRCCTDKYHVPALTGSILLRLMWNLPFLTPGNLRRGRRHPSLEMSVCTIFPLVYSTAFCIVPSVEELQSSLTFVHFTEGKKNKEYRWSQNSAFVCFQAHHTGAGIQVWYLMFNKGAFAK